VIDLPLPLHIIDDEQRGNVRAIGASTAPRDFIHAVASCGKSIPLQRLVAMYAAHQSRLSAEPRNVAVLLLKLRARVLRNEFLQGRMIPIVKTKEKTHA
jgi:hypothetical protein